MATDLDKSLLDVERKHDISLEQADWEIRQPQTDIQIHNDDMYASMPLEVIKEKWGFIPSAAHMTEGEEMHNCLRDLVGIIKNPQSLPPIDGTNLKSKGGDSYGFWHMESMTYDNSTRIIRNWGFEKTKIRSADNADNMET